ncbi:hypothetical protein DUI87_07395 [Hirundo rustica rustica]|uniref:Reverse transcriptase domain-containing protein n=1 Tax=Hirundo rustica rustica TaxID=333673 RepID=A0A3M0KRE8_HIRRU|nr:hypothetical protein DUI87_07395 [Hirundo rustica rustica]
MHMFSVFLAMRLLSLAQDSTRTGSDAQPGSGLDSESGLGHEIHPQFGWNVASISDHSDNSSREWELKYSGFTSNVSKRFKIKPRIDKVATGQKNPFSLAKHANKVANIKADMLRRVLGLIHGRIPAFKTSSAQELAQIGLDEQVKIYQHIDDVLIGCPEVEAVDQTETKIIAHLDILGLHILTEKVHLPSCEGMGSATVMVVVYLTLSLMPGKPLSENPTTILVQMNAAWPLKSLIQKMQVPVPTQISAEVAGSPFPLDKSPGRRRRRSLLQQDEDWVMGTELEMQDTNKALIQPRKKSRLFPFAINGCLFSLKNHYSELSRLFPFAINGCLFSLKNHYSELSR